MRRLVTYFPESNTAPVERWQTEISESEIEELKRIACEYQNKRIYINSCVIFNLSFSFYWFTSRFLW